MKDKKELSNYNNNNNSLDIDKLVDNYTPYIKTIIQNMTYNNLSLEDKEEIITDTFFIIN